MWKVVETKTEEIRIAETKKEREKKRRKKVREKEAEKGGRKKEKEKDKKWEDNRSEESDWYRIEEEKDHDEIVEEVVRRLAENDLYVKLEKCKWKV